MIGKKHEKEHKTKFVCLLNGPTQTFQGGHTCAFCDALNPDEQHLETHKIRACLIASNGPPSFERRHDMITHLKQGHGAADSKGLAEDVLHHD